MRILLMPSSYSPVIGGLQTVVRDLAGYLKGENHQVQVVTNRYPRSLPSLDIIGGINIRRWLMLKPEFKYLKKKRLDLFFASFFYYPKSLLALEKFIKEFNPQVINVHYPDNQVPFILKLRKRYKFKLVVSLHGYDIERWFNIDPRFKIEIDPPEKRLNFPEFVRLKELLEDAEAITACSRYLLDKAIEIVPAVKAKGHVAYNGIDILKFNKNIIFNYPKAYILAYGRLTYQKGFDLLLEAFQKVAAQITDLDLLIIGRGEQQEQLKEKSRQLELSQRVKFIEAVAYEDLAQYIKGSEFVVIPSRWEPFGLVALESFACKKTVVATYAGGIQEVVKDKINGLMVEKDSILGLSQAIIRLVKEKEFRVALESSTENVFKDFSKKNMGRFYEKLFAG